VISPRSLIDHDTIMFCLDTQRIAGIVQASNVDPKLAPEGHHLLVSHQTLPPGADWQTERDIALEDWRYLFGAAFDDCEVVGASQFPARFPVNWAAQGHDLRAQPFADAGLWIVGDAIKPPGHMMVEGVAAGTEQVIDHILRLHRT
jgi:phytoene dehydrogenase-like protein